MGTKYWVVEVVAVLEALHIFAAHFLSKCIVESDYMNVVFWVSSSVAPPWRHLFYFNKIKSLASYGHALLCPTFPQARSLNIPKRLRNVREAEIRVDRVQIWDQQESWRLNSSWQPLPRKLQSLRENSISLFVSNLSEDTSKAEIMFCKAGKIVDIFIPLDHNNERGRGFAFV